MSSANLLPPSAPPAEPLYPVVAAEPSQNFRLHKVSEISNTLAGEVHHYRLVAKKYKRARKFVKWGAAGSSVLSAAFSSASFGSALSVVGLPAAVPLGAFRSFLSGPASATRTCLALVPSRLWWYNTPGSRVSNMAHSFVVAPRPTTVLPPRGAVETGPNRFVPVAAAALRGGALRGEPLLLVV